MVNMLLKKISSIQRITCRSSDVQSVCYTMKWSKASQPVLCPDRGVRSLSQSVMAAGMDFCLKNRFLTQSSPLFDLEVVNQCHSSLCETVCEASSSPLPKTRSSRKDFPDHLFSILTVSLALALLLLLAVRVLQTKDICNILLYTKGLKLPSLVRSAMFTLADYVSVVIMI